MSQLFFKVGVLLTVFFVAYPCHAKETTLANKASSSSISTSPDVNYLSDFSLLLAGIITQYPFGHELGHYLGGRIAGVNLEFKESPIGGSNFKNNPSNQDKNIVTSSGFIFPMIISEASLDVPLSKDNPYIIGLILGPLIHNTSYIIQDLTSVKGDNYNDFETMDEAGIGREITYPIAIIIPAIQVYRLTRNKEAKNRWNLWMGVSGDQANIVISYKF